MAVYTEPKFDTPQRPTKQSKYERVLTPLMDEPETWAVIGEYSTSDSAYQAALNLRNGRYKIPGEVVDWEFLAEDNKVFAQFVKEVAPPKPTKATKATRTRKSK